MLVVMSGVVSTTSKPILLPEIGRLDLGGGKNVNCMPNSCVASSLLPNVVAALLFFF